MMRREKTILVVDDELIVAKGLQVTLQRLGYHVPFMVATGPEALHRTTSLQPDLILMDIRLKGEMDGIETARRIRDQFQVPVVFLTAFADEETLTRARQSEPFGYIVKPFETRNLQSTVETALHRAMLESRLRQSQDRMAAALELVGDGVLALDADGRVISLNPAGQVMSGWSAQEALGRDWREVFPLAVDPGGGPWSATAGLPVPGKITNAILSRRDGCRLAVSLAVAHLPPAPGRSSEAVLVLRSETNPAPAAGQGGIHRVAAAG